MKCFKARKVGVVSLLNIIWVASLLVCIYNCKDGSVKSEDLKVNPKSIDSTGVSESSDPDESVPPKRNCKYDLAEQNDSFLIGIEELKGYEWDDKEKSASIVLNDHWGLNIRRGGCDYFELSATFIHDKTLDLEENKEMVFDQVKWISELLEEFNSELIVKALDSNYVAIQQVSEGDYFINFLDERLSDDYFFRFQTWENATNFKIGQYIE